MANIGYKWATTIGEVKGQLSKITLNKTFTDIGLDRTAFYNCIEYLRPGDALHVDSMTKVSLSLVDLDALIDQLVKSGVVIVFHKEGLTFDQNKQGQLKTLKALASLHAEMARQQEKVKLEKAKEQGLIINSRTLPDKRMKKAVKMINDCVPKTKIAKMLGVSRSTLYSNLKSFEQRKAMGLVK